MLVSEEVRHSNKAWRAKHYEQRKAKEKSLDYYQAKVDQVNEKRLLEKNSTTILIWWDKRFDSETHPFMEKSVPGYKHLSVQSSFEPSQSDFERVDVEPSSALFDMTRLNSGNFRVPRESDQNFDIPGISVIY